MMGLYGVVRNAILTPSAFCDLSRRSYIAISLIYEGLLTGEYLKQDYA